MRMNEKKLLINTFVTNTAWTFNVHFDDVSDGTVTMTGADADNAKTGDGGPACSDHCHHGSALLLGLHRDSNVKHIPQHLYVMAVGPDRLTTRFPALPSEPPRA